MAVLTSTITYSSGQKNPSHGANTLGFLAELASSSPDKPPVSSPDETAATAAAAALGQRKKLLLPSSMSFSSGFKPTLKKTRQPFPIRGGALAVAGAGNEGD
uniref:Uncharacterized protein n=1 Tax=Oryza rufipogon TaxID=4529 RepID=A0A0E0NFR4_ORYRU